MSDAAVMDMMRATVPISRFNRGEASKIFDEVSASGTKVVLKNNHPACILVAPDKYEALMELLSDFILQEEAEKRMKDFAPEDAVSHRDVLNSLGISEADLAGVDVDIE